MVRTMNILLSLHFYYTLSRLKVKQSAESLQTQSLCPRLSLWESWRVSA